MEYTRIIKDSLHLFAGKAGTVIISLVNMMILARILTIEEMGHYSLMLMLVNLVLIVGMNWADTSIVRHGREEYLKSKKINQSFWARVYLFIPALIIFTLVFVLFQNQLAAYLGVSPTLIAFLIVMFILNGLLNFMMYLYQSIDKMQKSAYVLFSQKLFYLVLLGLVFFVLPKTSLTMVLLLTNVSFLMAVAVSVIGFDFKKIMPYVFNKEHFKRIWSYSWPQLIGFPGLYVINYIDLYVIKEYMTLNDVGIYNMAYTAFTNITMFIMIMYTVFMPLMVEYRATRNYQLIKNHFKKAPIFLAAWIVMVIIGISISQYVIPLIFSSKYVDSVAPFNILLIASIFYFASIYFLPIMNAFDFILYSQIFNLVKAIVNIIGDFLLVPKIGIIGAAYSTAMSYFVGLVLTIMLLWIKRKDILGEKH